MEMVFIVAEIKKRRRLWSVENEKMRLMKFELRDINCYNSFDNDYFQYSYLIFVSN